MALISACVIRSHCLYLNARGLGPSWILTNKINRDEVSHGGEHGTYPTDRVLL